MRTLNILVTGGCGFIGSNLIIYMLNKYPNYNIINLDLLTYAANVSNLIDVKDYKNYHFIKGDICDKNLVTKIFEEYNIQSVIHLAAESHVDNSIIGPANFIQTNILGTFILLEVAKEKWLANNLKTPSTIYMNRFLHISTDEVFGSLSDTGFFNEKSCYAPNSPYSASKASSDLLVRSYYKTYGLNVVTTNCSNNFGPRQHEEKLMPTIIKNAITLNKIPIYGDGSNVRDWIYVDDHCRAIDLVFHHGKNGEVYLIGGENERTNLEIAHLICDILDKKLPVNSKEKNLNSYKELIEFVEDRPGHDYRYAIDNKKIYESLGWSPQENFEEQLSKTIDWYIEYFNKTSNV